MDVVEYNHIQLNSLMTFVPLVAWELGLAGGIYPLGSRQRNTNLPPQTNTKLDCKPKLLNVLVGPCLHSFPDNMDYMGHKITKPIRKQLKWVD